jgi:hypothetical protein
MNLRKYHGVLRLLTRLPLSIPKDQRLQRPLAVAAEIADLERDRDLRHADSCRRQG